MTFEEYIQFCTRINVMANKFATFQNKVENTNYFANLHSQVSKLTKPIDNYNQQLKIYNRVFNSPFLQHIQTQQEILNKLTNSKSYALTTHISSSNSIGFVETSKAIIAEFESFSLPNELSEPKETVMELSKIKKPLTWEQVITIILFILTVVSFIQDQIPDKMEINTSNSLNKLIEIQEKELELLNKINNNISNISK